VELNGGTPAKSFFNLLFDGDTLKKTTGAVRNLVTGG
jgi:hypothetical protein